MNNITTLLIDNNEVQIELIEEKIEGLTGKPQSINIDNDRDIYFRPCSVEVSENNYKLVENICKNYMTQGVVEIGVSRNGIKSFTQALLTQKPNDVKYLGVDMEDKTYLDDIQKNIFTIKENSFNRDSVKKYMKEIGLDKISILFIDGWHSINAVINDWQYTELLSENGIVIFHDTNYHPGPAVVTRFIDTEKYKVEYHFENQDDYGIAIAYRL